MKKEIEKTYHLPLIELMNHALNIHRTNFNITKIQKSALCSIKTGGCPENCHYCSQSAHYKTKIQKTDLLNINQVISEALLAKQNGADRFCLGAAWRNIKDGSQFDQVIQMVQEVKKLGLETCCTLGMLNESQANRLKNAGLDFYNHNIDTSPEYYSKIVQTREFTDRIKTISIIRKSGIKVCTGGIIGLGESIDDRISFIDQLVKLTPQPESISINLFTPTSGTPLADLTDLAEVKFFDFIRLICSIRIHIPQSMIRLSAGRNKFSDEQQVLAFLCGVNSIFLGEKLLTASNRLQSSDHELFSHLGI